MIDSLSKNRIEGLIIGTLGSLLAALIIYLLKDISTVTIIMAVAIVIPMPLLYMLFFIIRAIGLSKLWLPKSIFHLNYRIYDAKSEYIAMGVTLNSMLQTTGVGFDIEKYAEQMPRALSFLFCTRTAIFLLNGLSKRTALDWTKKKL